MVSVCCVGHFIAHFATGLFPPIVELLRADLQLDFARAANLSLPGYFVFGAAALPFGFIASRFSGRKLLACGNLLVALGATATALSTSSWGIMLSLFVIGLGASIYHPVGYAMLSNSVTQRGRAHGLQGVFGNIGIATAPLLGGSIAYVSSWRWSYGALAIIAAIAALYSWMLQFDERVVVQASLHQRDLVAGNRRRGLLLSSLYLSTSLYGFVFRGWELLLPKHLGETLFNKSSAVERSQLALTNFGGATLTGAVLIVAAMGQLFGGRLADRIRLANGYLVFHALSLPFLIGLAYFRSPIALPFCAALFPFFSLGMQPLENSLFARYTPAKWRGLSYGAKFVLAFGLGSVAVAYVGPLTAQHGTSHALMLLAPFTLGVIGCAAAVRLIEGRGRSLT